jgi:hypothetical protein
VLVAVLDDGGERGGGVPRLTGGQLRFRAEFTDGQTHLLEPRRTGRQHAVTGDVGQCGTPPEIKGGPQQVERLVGPVLGEGGLPSAANRSNRRRSSESADTVIR